MTHTTLVSMFKGMKDIGHINTERISIEKLNPAEYNPRDISDKAREGLSNSITSFGLMQPIVWNKQTGNVVGGHQRLYEIISKGAEETDVIVVDFPLAKEKAANIALNHAGITGHYDDDKLQLLLSDIDVDMMQDLNLEELQFKNPASTSLKEVTDLSDQLKSEFKVEVQCMSEGDQQTLYERLTSEGYECRLLTL